ncbi:MAG: Mur ligase family protein, partial [Patescibacteria group bacterium]
MIKETVLDKILYQVKKIIPKSIFEFFQPAYHRLLAWGGAMRYGFPSHSMKLIGVTGTKGKSTTVYMITKILESSGANVAAIGSLGFKIKDKEWPNTLKQTMPGRFRLQKFLAEAKKAGCDFVILEVTSEGIKQYRHLGIKFDTAVFVNIHREHLENHGS